MKFNFRKLNKLKHAQPNSTVDECGVVKPFGDCQELLSKKMGKVLFKRDLTLADDSVRVHEYIHDAYLRPQGCSLILASLLFQSVVRLFGTAEGGGGTGDLR